MILVLGGDGFIGKSLIITLIKSNYKIKILKRSKVNKHFSHKNIKYVIGDISDYKILFEATKNVNIIINLAGIANIKYCQENINEAINVNGLAILNILKILKIKKNIKFIQISSSEVYGKIITNPVNETHKTNPLNSYGFTKLISEIAIKNFLKKYKRNIYILRFFNVFGEKSKKGTLTNEILQYLKNNKNIHLRNGYIKRDFVFIEDAVNAIILFVKYKRMNSDIVNICSGNSIQINSFARKIIKHSGLKLKLYSNKYIKNDNYDICGSNKKLLKVYKFKYKFNIDEGIKKLFNER